MSEEEMQRVVDDLRVRAERSREMRRLEAESEVASQVGSKKAE